MQISWLVKFGGIAYNMDKHIRWGGNLVIVNGNDVGVILNIAIVEAAIMLAIMMYIFPVKIAISNEKPRTWSYLWNPSQWSLGATGDNNDDDDFQNANGSPKVEDAAEKSHELKSAFFQHA